VHPATMQKEWEAMGSSVIGAPMLDNATSTDQ
jgi:hypothetical protein